MKLIRRYQTLPDKARCFHPGCSFHREGDSAEPLGAAHADVTGHEVRVQSGSVVIFKHERAVGDGTSLQEAAARVRQETFR